MNFLFLIIPFLFTSLDKNSVHDDERMYQEPPKLVVGIVVDQMRYDYLYRYWDKYEEGGFKRILNEGFSFDHALYNYAPTFTGPGHASVFTGATPSIHGIIENRWYSREYGRTTYVTDDERYETIGSDSDEGKMSPRYLKTSTIGDELRLHTNMESKVIGISLKDRGSILPAGYTGDAYWLDYASGNFISSTYYHEQLPEWVSNFNSTERIDTILQSVWEPLLEREYYESSPINEESAAFPGQNSSSFPHDLNSIYEHIGASVIAETPFGDLLVNELSMAAIVHESLGLGDRTDMIAIGYSSPDHIGHRFGPSSKEVQDTYIRLDRLLSELIDFLDDEIGMDDVLIFLTADHGAAHVPAYLGPYNIPSGYLNEREVASDLVRHLSEKYQFNPVESFRRFQVYLDKEAVKNEGYSFSEIKLEVADFLSKIDGIAGVITSDQLLNTDYTTGIRFRIQNGYYPKRSGDVLYWLDPQWMGTRTSGTTHGSPLSYDTRVPLLWYGWKIPSGNTTEKVYITDIASTVANFLKIPYPNGNEGNPFNDLFRKYSD